jgi:hypothetical protein
MMIFHVTLRYEIPDEMVAYFGGDEIKALGHCMGECNDDGIWDFEEVYAEEEAEEEENEAFLDPRRIESKLGQIRSN